MKNCTSSHDTANIYYVLHEHDIAILSFFSCKPLKLGTTPVWHQDKQHCHNLASEENDSMPPLSILCHIK